MKTSAEESSRVVIVRILSVGSAQVKPIGRI